MTNIKHVIFQKKRDVDMTTGSIVKHLISFAIPLLLGNLFQQLYNTVDAWVLGKFTTNEAYSAVGSVGPIINMLIGVFLGLASGAGVVISQFYGAKQYDKVHKTVHTCIALTFLLSAVVTAMGILITPTMLNLMKTPPEVIPQAKLYLTIYFAGVTGLMVYNMGAGILRAVGNSASPFIFLVISAVLNTVLDLVFVLVFHMGVDGVAYATIISQGVSAILVLISLLRSDSCIKLFLRELKISLDCLKLILKVGVPASIQMAVTSFSNVFVQSYINQFGTDCMGGWTTYSKLDQFMLLPTQSLALSATTFMGQNLGANNVKRAKKGIRTAIIMALCVTVSTLIPLYAFAPELASFFNNKPEVIEASTMILRNLCPFYVLICFNQICASALRGAGDSKKPMIIMLFSFVVFRQIYLFIMSNYICNELIPIALAYPAGWAMCSLIMFIYYQRTDLTKTRIIK